MKFESAVWRLFSGSGTKCPTFWCSWWESALSSKMSSVNKKLLPDSYRSSVEDSRRTRDKLFERMLSEVSGISRFSGNS